MKRLWMVCAMLACLVQTQAQDVSKIQFCDKKYEYAQGRDSITLFLKVLDAKGKSSQDVTAADVEKYWVMYEDEAMIANDRRTIV